MKRLTRMVVSVISLVALLGGINAYAASLPAAVSLHRPSSVPVAQGPVGPGFAVHPLWLKVRGYDRNGNPLFTSTGPVGYTPAQIQKYLGLTGTGNGETIAIVDAYADPNIQSDLATFDGAFVDKNANPLPSANLTVAQPEGTPHTNSGWALETSLDVEWAHAVAPEANILLVEAASSSFTNLMGAIDYAASRSGVVVISNSWGAGEFSGESSYDSHCAISGVVCTFSTGDSGNPGSYPAYNPHVIAVGGTTLQLNSDGTRSSETAWSGSGGGVSQYETEPSYQTNVQSTGMRGTPDVSYDADPNTGFPVYDSVKYQGQSGWFEVGGTSAGAPQWAAIIAAADQDRGSPLGSKQYGADTTLYNLTSGLYDVTTGSNGNCGSICQAGPGYDFVTGLGSPNAGIDEALANGSTTTSTQASVAISPSSTTGSTTAGSQVTYTFTVKNTGNVSDTYELTTSSSSGWTTSPSSTSATVKAGDSTSVTMTVTVPSTATGGSTDTETLTATSTQYKDSASATATTTVASSTTGTSASFEAVQWTNNGGRNHDKNVHATLTLASSGSPVSGATVSVSVVTPSGSTLTGSGTTNSSGQVTFSINNGGPGTYSLTVTGVTSTPTWDGTQPINETYNNP